LIFKKTLIFWVDGMPFYIEISIGALLALVSLTVIVRLVVSTLGAFKKFEYLDKPVQEKLLRVEFFMVLVRQLTAGELTRLSELSVEELQYLNTFSGDFDMVVKTAREKIDAPPAK
jgi:hypothetical protein